MAEITNCLACGNKTLKPCLDFKLQTPVNTLLSSPNELARKYPLALNYCYACSHGQLSYSVNPKELFENYLYASGTSKTLTEYFAWFAYELKEEWSTAKVLEIACNDGSLLKWLQKVGLDCVGVEPDKNLAEIARNTGVEVINDFWPCKINSSFDVIIAMNVLAHTSQPLQFLDAIKTQLSENGLCVIQVSHGDLLKTGQFDNIYHEHVSYFTRDSMQTLVSRVGLQVCKSVRLNIHGKSDVYVLSHKNKPHSTLGFLKKPPYFISQTPSNQIKTEELYETFKDLALNRLEEIDYEILDYIKNGKTIAFVGAAAKAIGIIQQMTFIPYYVFDEAPLKIGKWIPGTGIQIKPFSEIKAVPDNTIFVISAWNFKDELCEKVRKIREKETEFMVYFPKIEKWK